MQFSNFSFPLFNFFPATFFLPSSYFAAPLPSPHHSILHYISLSLYLNISERGIWDQNIWRENRGKHRESPARQTGLWMGPHIPAQGVQRNLRRDGLDFKKWSFTPRSRTRKGQGVFFNRSSERCLTCQASESRVDIINQYYSWLTEVICTIIDLCDTNINPGYLISLDSFSKFLRYNFQLRRNVQIFYAGNCIIPCTIRMNMSFK